MRQFLTTAERRKERIDRGIKVRTEGIYAISSWQEVLSWRSKTGSNCGPSLLPLVFQCALLETGCIHAGIYALLALWFDFFAHYVGLVCLGGAFFIGVGGYLSAIFNQILGSPTIAHHPPGNLPRRHSLYVRDTSGTAPQGRLFCHRHTYVSPSLHPDH